MKKIKALILRTAGTNCDLETAYAFKLAGAKPELVHINALLKKKSALDNYQILAIPGGFTYGDDVASGKILANELKFSLRKELSKFVSQGKLIIGICNGFQVLVKMGFLPDVRGKRGVEIDATLSLNDSGRFTAKWVWLNKSQKSKVKSQNGKKHASDEQRSPSDDLCVWTRGLPEVIYLPIAHAEGKFIPKNDKVLGALKENGQIVFRYVDNPNGSIDDIAGVCDPTGRIFGLMPHPERHVTYLQHPNWRRNPEKIKEMGVGLKIFKNAVSYVKNCL